MKQHQFQLSFTAGEPCFLPLLPKCNSKVESRGSTIHSRNLFFHHSTQARSTVSTLYQLIERQSYINILNQTVSVLSDLSCARRALYWAPIGNCVWRILRWCQILHKGLAIVQQSTAHETAAISAECQGTWASCPWGKGWKLKIFPSTYASYVFMCKVKAAWVDWYICHEAHLSLSITLLTPAICCVLNWVISEYIYIICRVGR